MINDIITTLLVAIGSVFMLIAAIGILRLPDFYTRMSAITKASTLGLGMVLLGISIHFDQIGVFAKSFIIITFLLLTNPVGAHAISRAAYKQRIRLTGNTVIDELSILEEQASRLEQEWTKNTSDSDKAEKLVFALMRLPSSHGGSFSKALEVAQEVSKYNVATGNRLIGTVYWKMGRKEKAERFLKQACEDCNYSHRATFTLVEFYIDNDLPNRALAALEEAMQRHPDDYEFPMKAILVAFDFGVSHKFGLECCNRIIALSDVAPSDYLLQASRYKRFFVERLTGK